MGVSLLKYYIDLLSDGGIPDFLYKYFSSFSLMRLKKVGYFCGMDYASKDIYNFSEYISRYDHSLTVSLITYKLTKDKEATLAGLFHDIATPCFSHVIDYMNKDYEKQESTEEYTGYILKRDKYLLDCFKKDYINVDDIINFKKYSIVDNDRPKVCADRIDGVILTGIGWTKNISSLDIKNIVCDMRVFNNEDGEEEIGFSDTSIANKVVVVSESIDRFCHSKEDNYMMELLANTTRLGIEKSYIKYDDLYLLNEEEIFNKLISCNDLELKKLILTFKTIRNNEIYNLEMPKIKVRELRPLVGGKRM